MTSKNKLTPAMLNQIMKRQEEAAKAELWAELQKNWDEHGEVIDTELLLRLGYAAPSFWEFLRSNHPAAHKQALLQNVERAYQILKTSHSALVGVAGRFQAYLEHHLGGQDLADQTLNDATKEVYTYSCASSSLVQAYRRLRSGWTDIQTQYDALKGELIDTAEVIGFMSELRTSNNHYEIVRASPSYSISWPEAGGREIKSHLEFDRKAILTSNDWNEKAKTFIASRTSTEVLPIVDEHFAVVSAFNKVFIHRTGIRKDKGFRDLERILQAQKVVGAKISLSILLQQAFAGNLNPYEYLEDHFTPEELKNIYAFRDHTSEQIEYMISLRDPFGFCDQGTRKELYKLFGVPAEQSPLVDD